LKAPVKMSLNSYLLFGCLRYFSDKVSPAVHDKAMKSEGFGVWKEDFMFERFAQQERLLWKEIKMRSAAETRKKDELAKEHEVR
jgi:hypothetical protein